MEPQSSRLEQERQIHELIGKGEIEQALAAFYQLFSEISDQKSLERVIALQSDWAQLLAYEGKGTLSYEEASRHRVRITTETLALLKALYPADIAAPPGESLSIKSGRLLHNIPPVMKTGALHTCRVRIATKDYQLRQSFHNPYDIKPITLDKIGDKMEVEIESADPEAFYIQRCNPHLQQVVEPDIATEWVFDVVPQKVGNYQLRLKVTIVQEQNGQVTHRDHVISIGVEVSTVRSGIQETWVPAINIARKAGFSALGAATRTLAAKMTGREGKRSAAGALIATALIAATLLLIIPSPLQREILSLVHAPLSSERTVVVIVHSEEDHAVRDFSLIPATKNYRMPQANGNAGQWQTTVSIPRDTAGFEVYFKGDVRTRYWQLDSLPDTLHLYINSLTAPKAEAMCWLRVITDTIVTAVHDWHLVVSDSGFNERLLLPAQPYDDTTYTVYMPQDACDWAYRGVEPSYFSFKNGSLAPHNTRTGPFAEDPATLRFHYRLSKGPDTYNQILVRLNFSTPIEFTRLNVNGQPFDGAVTPLQAADDQKLWTSLSFTLNSATDLSETYRFRVDGNACNCLEATLKTKDHSPYQEYTLEMLCIPDKPKKPGVAPPPPPPAKSKVILTFGQKWIPYLKDLEIWQGSDRALYREIRLNNKGEFPLELDPVQPDRSICIRFYGGAKSGRVLEVACRSIRLGKNNVNLKLDDSNQLVLLK